MSALYEKTQVESSAKYMLWAGDSVQGAGAGGGGGWSGGGLEAQLVPGGKWEAEERRRESEAS